MRIIRRQGLTLVSAVAALASSALLIAPPAAAAPTDPVLLANLNSAGWIGGWSLGGSTYWLGNLVASPSGGAITAVTINMTANSVGNFAGTSVRVFADDGGAVDFDTPYGFLAYESAIGTSWTYTGSVTVPAGQSWIGLSYTGNDGLPRDISNGDSGANATGPWTFAECPAAPTPGMACIADGPYTGGGSVTGSAATLWPEIAIYGVVSGGSGTVSSPITRTEFLQQVRLPESGDCTAVEDAEFAWNTGLTGGWKSSWAQWASSGGGGPICTRMLVNDGQTWGLE